MGSFKITLEKSDNFGQNLLQNQANLYMSGSLFHGKFAWVNFQISGGTSLSKTKLKGSQLDAFSS